MHMPMPLPMHMPMPMTLPMLLPYPLSAPRISAKVREGMPGFRFQVMLLILQCRLFLASHLHPSRRVALLTHQQGSHRYPAMEPTMIAGG